MRYVVPQELRTKAQVYKGWDITSFIFIVCYFFFGYMVSTNLGLVHPSLIVPFNIFNLVMGVALIMPSPFNKGKKFYHSIFFMLNKDKYTYHSISTKYDLDYDTLSTKIIKNRLTKELNKNNEQI